MKRKHGLFLFLASCIPGCGEMHQGYMKRGASILTAFCAIFALAIFLEIAALAILMLPLWLFSFFDSYNLRAQSDEEAAANPDEYLFGFSDLDSKKLSDLCRKRHSVVGWVLVALGGYLLYDRLVRRILGDLLWQVDWLFDLLIYDVPRLAMTIGIIALGVWFIRGPKKAAAEEIPPFTPSGAETEKSHEND
ncbi:hypothetical protein [Oscillibacter sp.]|uniref:hypothetical protein n=1 Tax=Oscillibacter sp. TaxID=1945593 RepID=UPI00262C5423|nr:hypothetical protein [Oscillibacter sp.]MDD3346605.1 hypothetical protein [Oscillibacter sp.]